MKIKQQNHMGMKFLLGTIVFSCYVSFREGSPSNLVAIFLLGTIVCITVKIIDFVFTSFTNSNPGGVSKMSMCKIAGNFFEFWDVEPSVLSLRGCPA